MPKRAQYSLDWSPEQAAYLIIEAETRLAFLLDDKSADWQLWLLEHRALAFRGQKGHLNLLKEQRRRGSEGYWYAYQRRAGSMVKRYLGRSEQVRVLLLEEIAALFADEAQPVHLTPQTIVPEPRKRGRSQRLTLNAAKEKLEVDQNELISSARISLPVALQFESLLMPKLQLPRLQSSLLQRQHLWALLDKGLEYKLTLISGPAGYGKTTLVSQWIATRSASAGFPRVAYVTLDEGDNDPIRFWRYLIAACQSFRADFGRETLELLLAHRLPPFKPLEMMLVALLNELSHLEYPGLLVLDDVHVLNSPQVVASLSFLLEHLPASFHLLLLIRGDPPFSLVHMHAHNEVLDIYPPYLRFTWEEMQAFFAQELPFPLSQKTLRQIDERLDAWPAGLRLLARELGEFASEEEIEPILAAFAGSHWSVREYFLSEVVHTLPEDQQKFLLETSLLPRLNASLCQAVTGREDSAQLLTALRTGDRFLIPLDRKGEWARYHTLFAQSMQEEAQRTLGDEEIRQLAYRASIWYEAHDLLTDAIITALDAHTFPRAAGLIERFLLSREQNNVAMISPEIYNMQRWLESLPVEELERRPELCLHYAMVLLFLLMERPRVSGSNTSIQHLLQVAEEQWRDASNTARLGSVFAFRALLAGQEGKLLQAITWARQSLVWLPPEERLWRNLSLTVVGNGEVLEGNLDQARAFFLEALALSDQQGNLIYARATRSMLGGVSLAYGELHHAAEQWHEILAQARIQEDYGDIAHAQSGLAQLAYQWNKLDEAEQAVREVLAVGEQFNQVEFLATATLQLAQIEHARGASSQALQRLTSWLAHNSAPASPLAFQLSREIQAALARIQLASGQLAPVEHWFASIEGSASNLPLLQQQREQLLYTRLLLAQGKTAPAISQLENLYAAAMQTRHIALGREIQVLLALAYARQGWQDKARARLYELLFASLNEGYLRLFLDEGEELLHLLRSLLPSLQEKSLLARARALLNTSGPEAGQPEAIFLNEPLSPQEKKVLRLLAYGNSNAGIARELVVSVNTVRTQLQSIYRKLNVNNRVAASAAASQLELL